VLKKPLGLHIKKKKGPEETSLQKLQQGLEFKRIQRIRFKVSDSIPKFKFFFSAALDGLTSGGVVDGRYRGELISRSVGPGN